MRILLVRKSNDIIPFISFFHNIPSSSSSWAARGAYSTSCHSNKGKVGEISNNDEWLDVSEIGRIGDANIMYAEMVSVGLMPNLYTDEGKLNSTFLCKSCFSVAKKYLRMKDPARYDQISQLTTAMKDLAGKGFIFDATKALLLANVVRESPPFLDMIVGMSKTELIDATQGIEEEISALQSEDKKLVAEIKRTAKTNKTAAAVLLHQLFKLRHQIAIKHGIRDQMRGIATHMKELDFAQLLAMGMQDLSTQLDLTTDMISDAIDDVIDNDEAEEEIEDMTNQQMDPARQAKLMQVFSRQSTQLDMMDTMHQMDPTKQAKVMQDFPRQSTQLDMMTEMISDTIGDVIDNGEPKEEIEDVTNKVSNEIGVDVASSQLVVAPKGKIAGKRTEELSSSKNEPKKILDGCT